MPIDFGHSHWILSVSTKKIEFVSFHYARSEPLIFIKLFTFSVSKLKFRCEETGNLNDILLRISAFGVFVYSAFSIISGALNLYPLDEPSLLVTVTSSVVVLQVVLQLLFIADVSRRRVHLPVSHQMITNDKSTP